MSMLTSFCIHTLGCSERPDVFQTIQNWKKRVEVQQLTTEDRVLCIGDINQAFNQIQSDNLRYSPQWIKNKDLVLNINRIMSVAFLNKCHKGYVKNLLWMDLVELRGFLEQYQQALAKSLFWMGNFFGESSEKFLEEQKIVQTQLNRIKILM